MTRHQRISKWSVVLLCLSSALALGGGVYETVVLMPLWSASPPASFSIIQPGTGVPLQTFWIPVHAAITVLSLAALVLTWRDRRVRRWLLSGLASYLVMRAWRNLSTCLRQRVAEITDAPPLSVKPAAAC